MLRAAIGFSAFHDLQVKSRNQLLFSLDEKNYRIKKKPRPFARLKKLKYKKRGNVGDVFVSGIPSLMRSEFNMGGIISFDAFDILFNGLVLMTGRHSPQMK